MSVMPAMPPVDAIAATTERDLVAKGEEAEWLSAAHYAYCHAQALADRDGIRRRVFKEGNVWRVVPVGAATGDIEAIRRIRELQPELRASMAAIGKARAERPDLFPLFDPLPEGVGQG
jgi:hypothetical protein